MDSEIKDWKRITLGHDGTCITCVVRLKTGSPARWSPSQRSISCLSHDGTDIPSAAPLVTHLSQEMQLEAKELLVQGVPGGSARKMDEKQKYRIEVEDEGIKERYRAEHPKIARVMKNAENSYPSLIAWMRRELNTSHELSSWSKGAEGEEIVGRELEELSQGSGFITIHDRLIPGQVANIDHIVVTSSKVFVVDAKNYADKIDFGKLLAPYFGGKAILKINGRNRNKLVESVEKQVRIVEQLLAKAGIDIPVQGVLAFVNAKWGDDLFPAPQINKWSTSEFQRSSFNIPKRPTSRSRDRLEDCKATS